MKNQLPQDVISLYFEILESDYYYEQIKEYALHIMELGGQEINIDDGECKVIFNPYRIMLIERLEDEGLEHFFDVEVICGDVEPTQQKNFKTAFVIALTEMLEIDFFNNEN